MLKGKTASKIFSSGLQAVAIQVMGSAFFYLISVYLPKTDFGLISWMNALCLFATTLLGFGLEQVVVRRISVSKTSDWAASAYFVHAVVGVLFTLLILSAFKLFFKPDAVVYKLLPWFFIGQGIMYMVGPLKQYLNAKEKFGPYGKIAIASNVFKVIAAWLLFKTHIININNVVLVLIACAAFELACMLAYLFFKTSFKFKFNIKAYVKLLAEAAPQFVAVVFDMSLSRIDWILLGIITTNVALADYSFAYRAFELSRLPVMIIGPLILPRLARMMAANSKAGFNSQHLNSFNTIELFFAILIPLCLNILWVPVVTFITGGKYGQANSWQFLILSLCVPLQFFINLLWSLAFGAKKYKPISAITIGCAITNLILNLILIPRFNGTGASVAFLATTILQALLYYNLSRKQNMAVSLKPLLFFGAIATMAYLLALKLNLPFYWQLFTALILYGAGAFLSKQVNRIHFNNFKLFLSR